MNGGPPTPARLGILLTLSGFPAYDHLKETSRTGYRITENKGETTIWYDKPQPRTLSWINERSHLIAQTVNLLNTAEVTCNLKDGHIHVPHTRPDGLPNHIPSATWR